MILIECADDFMIARPDASRVVRSPTVSRNGNFKQPKTSRTRSHSCFSTNLLVLVQRKGMVIDLDNGADMENKEELAKDSMRTVCGSYARTPTMNAYKVFELGYAQIHCSYCCKGKARHGQREASPATLPRAYWHCASTIHKGIRNGDLQKIHHEVQRMPFHSTKIARNAQR